MTEGDSEIILFIKKYTQNLMLKISFAYIHNMNVQDQFRLSMIIIIIITYDH